MGTSRIAPALLAMAEHTVAEHACRRGSRDVDGLHHRCFPLPRFPDAY